MSSVVLRSTGNNPDLATGNKTRIGTRVVRGGLHVDNSTLSHHYLHTHCAVNVDSSSDWQQLIELSSCRPERASASCRPPACRGQPYESPSAVVSKLQMPPVHQLRAPSRGYGTAQLASRQYISGRSSSCSRSKALLTMGQGSGHEGNIFRIPVVICNNC